jgi:hypothetical protein
MGQNNSGSQFKTQSSCRRKREFIPDEKKDNVYWERRRKNNEAAKRSREKRRVNDMVLENRVLALLEENARLRAELLALKFRFGLVKDPSSSPMLPLANPAPQRPSPYYLPRADHQRDLPGAVAGQPREAGPAGGLGGPPEPGRRGRREGAALHHRVPVGRGGRVRRGGGRVGPQEEEREEEEDV